MLTGRRTQPAPPRWTAQMVSGPRFEMIPLPGIGAEVTKYLPPESTVTVTASPRRGLEPTLELATELAWQGVHAVPHLAARMIADESELADILGRLTAAGITEVFVIGGDGPEPAGQFTSAQQLLSAMARIGHEMSVGIAGYPESHPQIPDDVTIQAMWDKQAHAHYIVSQMCFDSRALLEWVRRVRRRGVGLPILVGLAGPASSQHLLRISSRIGVGESMRVLSKHRGGLRRLAAPGRWQPDRLLQDITPAFADPAYGLQGLHIYTFNAVASVGQWWQQTAGHPPAAVSDDGYA